MNFVHARGLEAPVVPEPSCQARDVEEGRPTQRKVQQREDEERGLASVLDGGVPADGTQAERPGLDACLAVIGDRVDIPVLEEPAADLDDAGLEVERQAFESERVLGEVGRVRDVQAHGQSHHLEVEGPEGDATLEQHRQFRLFPADAELLAVERPEGSLDGEPDAFGFAVVRPVKLNVQAVDIGRRDREARVDGVGLARRGIAAFARELIHPMRAGSTRPGCRP